MACPRSGSDGFAGRPHDGPIPAVLWPPLFLGWHKLTLTRCGFPCHYLRVLDAFFNAQLVGPKLRTTKRSGYLRLAQMRNPDHRCRRKLRALGVLSIQHQFRDLVDGVILALPYDLPCISLCTCHCVVCFVSGSKTSQPWQKTGNKTKARRLSYGPGVARCDCACDGRALGCH